METEVYKEFIFETGVRKVDVHCCEIIFSFLLLDLVKPRNTMVILFDFLTEI
jgi:hypothetical protein